MSEPDHVRRNKEIWAAQADGYVAAAEAAWSAEAPYWGLWRQPESALRLLPDVSGLDVVELGCGTGYVSAWLARLGARPVGIDPTPQQLDTARRMMARFGPSFPVHEAHGEALPFADDAFDLAISEYGACMWADPYGWVPEAARVLRPGGRLIFLTSSFFVPLCGHEDEAIPADEVLKRPYLGLHRVEWSSGEIEFALPHGEWIRLLAEHGFTVTRLDELGAPPDASSRYTHVSPEWSRRFPSEEVWFATLR